MAVITLLLTNLSIKTIVGVAILRLRLKLDGGYCMLVKLLGLGHTHIYLVHVLCFYMTAVVSVDILDLLLYMLSLFIFFCIGIFLLHLHDSTLLFIVYYIYLLYITTIIIIIYFYHNYYIYYSLLLHYWK